LNCPGNRAVWGPFINPQSFERVKGAARQIVPASPRFFTSPPHFSISDLM
jgi:hypothetical protein